MKRWILLVAVLLVAGAAALWYWQSRGQQGAGTGLVCARYTEHRKDVAADLTIPQLKDTKAPVYKVLAVIDGDTIAVKGNGREFKVRFMAMDAPEKSSTRYGHPEAFGEEAYRYVKARIDESDGQVRLTYDATKVDKYDRDLAYVWLKDGRMLNALLVSDGYAYSYSSSPKPLYVDLFLALMRDARAHNRGLWAVCR
ncbi:MAG TPA: thermonuclease family protein [Symbiobacteriaceae bacterium]|jgi:micrococcal nuclease